VTSVLGEGWVWLPFLLAALLVLGWYLSFSATRIDRLHHRVESTRTALDVQLVRRSAAAVEAAQHLDPASALLVTDAATRAMQAGELPDFDRDPLEVPPQLEVVENDLSRALQAAFAEPPDGAGPFAADAAEVLAQAPTHPVAS
jgi:hypothetical protein